MSVVPNIGRAGSEYDLLLGALGDKGAYARAFNGVMVDSQGGANELLPPSRFPSTIPPEKRDADHTAPLVALALPATAAGTRVDVTTPAGQPVSVARPEFNATAITAGLADADGRPLEVHVVPVRRPISSGELPLGALLNRQVSVAEDSAAGFSLWGVNPQGSALPASLVITEPIPVKGQLWAGNADSRFARTRLLNQSGLKLANHGGVQYVPHPDVFGEAMDAAAFLLQLDASPSLVPSELGVSEVSLLSITGLDVNDLPLVEGSQLTIDEDSGPLRVSLQAPRSSAELLP